jgi:hypothetical protein
MKYEMQMQMQPIYIICHPEYEPIRYQLLLKQLEKARIPFNTVQWIRGPWGNEVDSLYFNVYDPFNKRLGLDKALSFKSACLLKGEVSLCVRFHLAVKKALEDGAETVIFFESDAVLREDFLERLRDILSSDKPWDYISLGEGVGTRPSQAKSYFSKSQLYTPPHQFVFRCTDSMVFRRSFLEKLSQTLIPFRECLDWELNVQMLAHKGVPMWADPPLVEPGSGRSRTMTLLPS